ncbi:septum formation initiator family protein [Nisaea acidiphila]|uniref:Septum formation initiator family protein n=1 Tax=Nisaea acidiphila TaxID=1862145 RepID=A0A9J7AUR0_9PROT|nr:septum formation initiator family protein [Nisaea acidiphila]UUX50201.1 septum formation initiator family protein [Nisaea acidiphila]
MTLAFELKRRARQIVGPVIGCLLLGYFIFHAVEGDRGLHAWQALDAKIEAAESKLAALQATRESMERKVAMLHPESIDRDLLTEQARVVLNYLGRDEFVLQDLGGFSVAAMGDGAAAQPKTQAISIASNSN